MLSMLSQTLKDMLCCLVPVPVLFLLCIRISSLSDFARGRRGITVGILACYLGRDLLSNIHFRGECLYILPLLSCSILFPSSTFIPVTTKLPICFFDMSQHFLAFSTRASDATVLISFQLCDVLLKFVVFTFIYFLINVLNFSHPLSRPHFALL